MLNTLLLAKLMECNSVVRELTLTVKVWVSDPPNFSMSVYLTLTERAYYHFLTQTRYTEHITSRQADGV